MASYFVTGGNGFVGRHLVSYLKRQHHTVVTGSRDTNTDFTDLPTMDRLFKKYHFDYVFHLAAAGTRGKHLGGEDLLRTNIMGTFEFISLLKKYPVKGFVLTGSSSEYGVCQTPIKETDALLPTFTFAGVKAASTMLATAMAYEYGIPIITIRPFALYGPNDRPDRFIPTVIHAALNNTPITVYPGAHDWIYVDDLVFAMTHLIHHAKKYVGQPFNIGTGITIDNLSVIQTIEKIIGHPMDVTVKNATFHQYDNNHWIADTTKLQRVITWNPLPFETGIRKTLTWYAKEEK